MNRTNPIGRLSPGITTVIRMDHTNVLASFHGYVSTRIDTAPASAADTADMRSRGDRSCSAAS